MAPLVHMFQVARGVGSWAAQGCVVFAPRLPGKLSMMSPVFWNALCPVQEFQGPSPSPPLAQGGCGVWWWCGRPRRREPLSPAPLSHVTQWMAFCFYKVPFSIRRRVRKGVEVEPRQAKF